jgi:hypothetical protein
MRKSELLAALAVTVAAGAALARAGSPRRRAG